MNLKSRTVLSACFVLFFVGNAMKGYAQQDDELLDLFVKSKGYNQTIVFDSSNIKQYWIDNTVLSAKDSIVITLTNKSNAKQESNNLKIQLANVDVQQDCTITVITETPGASFLVLDKSNNIVSKSEETEDFMQYHVVSSTVHLEDLLFFTFNMKFVSNTQNTLSIKKIVLSFSTNNNQSINSPKVLTIGSDGFNTDGTQSYEEIGKYSFSVTGIKSKLTSKKNIILSDRVVTNYVKVKNTGDKPVRIYFGYEPYTKDGEKISDANNCYNKNNKILKVVSHEENSNFIIVDSFPTAWIKGCRLALNAKDDYSDFPNFSLVEGVIQSVEPYNDNQAKIIFDKPIEKNVATGTPVRIHSPLVSAYIYTNMKTLQPGEEAELTSSLKKDNTLLEYSSKGFCRGTHYVVPVILSYTYNSGDCNTVRISDVSFWY